jgi:tRNA-uridine 2-sulfurtransferase
MAKLLPKLARPQGELKLGASGPVADPAQAEVPDRGAARSKVSLEQDDRVVGVERKDRVHEAEDAAADDDNPARCHAGSMTEQPSSRHRRRDRARCSRAVRSSSQPLGDRVAGRTVTWLWHNAAMRVLVAMSGGVDSSVAAALLLDAGHHVVGCTLRLWGGESDAGCCSAADVDDARRVSQLLGIDHHVFNLAEQFEAVVVEPYVAAHARGETPNPCVACNRSIKFDALLARAARIGFDALATGHHARVLHTAAGATLRRGADAAKDQSYVLGFLSARQLDHLVLPVGEFTKDVIRSLARDLELRTADKPDSQEVCFIPRQGRASFLSSRTTLTPGTLVDRGSGAVVGTIPAVELVTVGQRRGLGVGRDGRPRFVAAVDVATATVMVTSHEHLFVERLDLAPGSLTWTGATIAGASTVLTQTSAHGAPVPATLQLGVAPHLELQQPVRPVAPGQLAVFYDEWDPDRVVGAATVVRRAAAAA